MPPKQIICLALVLLGTISLANYIVSAQTYRTNYAPPPPPVNHYPVAPTLTAPGLRTTIPTPMPPPKVITPYQLPYVTPYGQSPYTGGGYSSTTSGYESGGNTVTSQETITETQVPQESEPSEESTWEPSAEDTYNNASETTTLPESGEASKTESNTAASPWSNLTPDKIFFSVATILLIMFAIPMWKRLNA